MKSKTHFLLLICGIFFWSSCFSSTSPQNPTQGSIEKTKGSATRLKEGTKIVLQLNALDAPAFRGPQKSLRTLMVETPSGAEGLSFFWNSSEESSLGKQRQGKLSLPNMVQAQRMTLPLFWPEGDLYLSNSSGIWLSDAAYQELKKEREVYWGAGLVQNPLLGPSEDHVILENSLAALKLWLGKDPEKLKTAFLIKSKRWSKKFSLKLGGEAKEVKVIEAGNWMIRYKILDDPQNPLILESTLAPDFSPGEILFSPLGWLKGLAEYRVLEIQEPPGLSS